VQNIILLFADVGGKRSLIFCARIVVREREELGEGWYFEDE
jgi:hypothetical protein